MLLSEKTPAWFLDRWPNRRVIMMAYGDEFAVTWGRKVRDLLVEARANGFTSTEIVREGDAAVGEWFTSAGGGMKTAGVMSGRRCYAGKLAEPASGAFAGAA
jgi:hypothetical protein